MQQKTYDAKNDSGPESEEKVPPVGEKQEETKNDSPQSKSVANNF